MSVRSRTFRALDFVFDVRGPADIATLFDEAFGDLVTDEPSAATIEVRHRRHHWTVGCRPDPVRHGQLVDVVAFVIDVVNHRAVRSVATGVGIHAAAVATPTGVIALAGRSGAGKSTLAAAAARHGLGYVADEITMVEPDLTVRAFHRPIGLRAGGAAAAGVDVPAHGDGRFDDIVPYRPPRESLVDGGRLAGLCVLQFDETTTPRADEMRPAEALVELASGALGNAAHNERDWFKQLAAIVDAVPAMRLTYGDATAALSLLRSFHASI